MDLRVHKWLSYVDTLATTAHTRPAQRLELPRIPPGVVSHPGRPYHRERDRYQAAPRSVSARGPRMCRQGPPGWSSPIVPHTNHVEAPQDREHEMASNARRVAPMDPRATRSERSAPLPVPDVGLDSPVGGDWKIEFMMIGQLAARTGLSVRTLRFYADAGLLVEEGRSGSGYRVFGTEAVHRGRLIRTLRELAGLLRDPDFIATSHRMAAVGEVAGPAARAGVDQRRLRSSIRVSPPVCWSDGELGSPTRVEVTGFSRRGEALAWPTGPRGWRAGRGGILGRR